MKGKALLITLTSLLITSTTALACEYKSGETKFLDYAHCRYDPDSIPLPVVEPGERVVFFMATTQTKSGTATTHVLPDGQYLIRETDVLFVTTDDVAVTV